MSAAISSALAVVRVGFEGRLVFRINAKSVMVIGAFVTQPARIVRDLASSGSAAERPCIFSDLDVGHSPL